MKKLFFLLLTAVCAILYGPPASAWTVYLDPANLGTGTPKIYLYGGGYSDSDWNTDKYEMTPTDDGRWVYTSSDAAEEYGKDESATPGSIIFIKSDGTQSQGNNELAFSDGKTYTWNGTAYSVPSSATWEKYTIYVDDQSGQSSLYFYAYGANNYSPLKLGNWGSTESALKLSSQDDDNGVYIFYLAINPKSGSTPHIMLSSGGDSWKSTEPELKDGHKYTISSSKQLTDNGVYDPVTVTGVELWKDGTAISKLTAAPYEWNLSGLTGAEKFLVKVYTAKADGTSASVTNYTASAGGTGLTSTNATNGFSIDSKVFSAKMTVNLTGTAATSYALTNTVNDAVTGVEFNGQVMTANGSTYTLTGIANTSSTGYTIKVRTTRDDIGKFYTVSTGTTNLLAGDYTLTQKDASFTVSPTITTFNASVTVNTSTLSATGLTITDPNAVISAVKLVRCDGNQTITLTTDDGATWTWHGTDIKTYKNGTASTDRSYQLVVTNGGEQQKWYYNSSNEPFNLNTTYSDASKWKTVTSANEYFRFTDEDNCNNLVTVTLSADKKSIASLRYERYTGPVGHVHMPLTAKDFASGPRYFLVGTRMGDWRLQPEWELKVDGNTATLKGRLMYKGMFGIAKVDSYQDYLFHRYTLYVRQGQTITYDGQTVELNSSRSAQAIRYDDSSTTSQFTGSNTMKWQSQNTNWDANAMVQSKPALLNGVTVTLNSSTKAPNSVKFDYTTDDTKVAAARTFSLVGANFRYEGNNDGFTDGVEREIDKLTPANGRKGTANKGNEGDKEYSANTSGWANGWVLYDQNGAPYVDGYGNVMYCTAYDKDWLAKNPVQFYLESQDFTYSSLGTTFIPSSQLPDLANDPYSDLYKMHPASDKGGSDRIGGTNESKTGNVITYGNFSYKEHFEDNSSDGKYWLDDYSKYQCYVVKGMWINGPFKIWEGWGGNLKAHDDVTDYDNNNLTDYDKKNIESAERWFYENGGHGYASNYSISGSDPDVKKGEVNVYRTRRDVNDANFKIDNLTYFDRVILWYNPDAGMEGSAIQLVRSTYGPNIQAFRNTDGMRNTLRYRWKIDVAKADDHSCDNYKISTYTVTRYKVVDGEDTDPVEVITVKDYNETIGAHRSTWTAELDDSRSLSAGIYRYHIDVTFTYSDESGTHTVKKSAISNTVNIYEAQVPVELTAVQQMMTRTGGETVVDNDGGNLYTFNIQLDMKATEKALSTTVNGKSVKDMMQRFVLVADKATYERISDSSTGVKLTLGGETISGDDFDDFWTTSTGSNALIGKNQYVEKGLNFHVFEVSEVGTKVPTLVWTGVNPNVATDGSTLHTWGYSNSGLKKTLTPLTGDDVKPYSFQAYLVSNDSDVDAWAELNFDVAEKATDVKAPETKLKIDNIALAKAVGNSFSHDPYTTTDTHTDHLSGTRLLKSAADTYEESMERYDDGEQYRTANRIRYDRLNEVTVNTTIEALDFVAGNVNLDYDIYITPAGTPMTGNYDNVAYYALLSDTEPAKVTDEDGEEIEYACATIKDLTSELDVKFYDPDLGGWTTRTSIDGSHSTILDGEQASTFDGHIFVTYKMPNGKELVNVADKGDTKEFNPEIKKPGINIENVVLAKYEGKFYHSSADDDQWHQGGTCGVEHDGPMTENLGTFVHAMIDFRVDNIDTEDRNGFVAFHVQQPVYNDEDHNNGCYPGIEKTNSYGEREYWSKFQFAGTRPANGGAPVGAWAKDFTANAATPIAPLADNDSGTEYAEHDGKSVWTSANDWSTMAIKARHLPIHVNPIYKYPKGGTAFSPAKLTAKFAAIYPIIKTNRMFVEARTVSGIQPANKKATLAESLARQFGNVYLMGADDEVSYENWNENQIVTGVEEILGDNDKDAPVEYYNLQGIRVVNPAKGQIYIKRQGAKATKVLYK